MSERFFKWLLTEKRFSRNDFLRTPAEAAAAFGIAYGSAETYKVFTPKKEEFGYIEKIDDETRQKLMQFRPATVAHRGANTFDRFIQSIDAGVDFAEADIRSSLGRLVISHDEEWQLLAYDLYRRLIGLSPIVPNVEELAKVAKSQKQKLFLDLKENQAHLTDRAIEQVYQNGLQYQVSYFGRKWSMLDRVSTMTQRENNLFYTIGGMTSLKLFLDQQLKRQRQGVALDTKLVQEETVKELHETGVKVYAAVVLNSQQALKVLNCGVNGIVSHDLSLLSIWGKPVSQKFFV